MKNKFSNSDHHFMRVALNLGARGLGQVWPNPSVGCVIVDQNSHIIGRGHTAKGGRPHGEVQALSHARSLGFDVRGATVYVTLEPCAHHGQTPPCAEALAEAGVARVVIASLDPDERVSGKGIAILEAANIEVNVGLLKEKSDFQHAAFFSKCRKSLPLITVKFATSSDGKIADKNGYSKWITCPASRMMGHRYRAMNDAIMVGVETVLKDDPDLTCRISGLEDRSPVRIILDSSLRTPLQSKLMQSAHKTPLWLLTVNIDQKTHEKFQSLGAKIIVVAPEKNQEENTQRVNIKKAMELLSDFGITSILSEGGSSVNSSLMDAGLMARVICFKAPKVMGEDAIAALRTLDINDLKVKMNLKLIKSGAADIDKWYYYSA
jgi:diaminohydroxyphosphoribosylaminopyrimidine deaminase/5-amino-6-(5-phosphoribosylamino)uracil reductase